VSTHGRTDDVWPCYLVIDVSQSMKGHRLDLGLRSVSAIVNLLHADPNVSDRCRIALLQFSARTRMVMPLSQVTTLRGMPGVSVEGGVTCFGEAFSFLRGQLTTDVQLLMADDFRVCRPTVLLLTDGEAGDDWEDDFVRLTEYDSHLGQGFPWYPIVVPIGIGVDDAEELRQFTFPPQTVRAFAVSSAEQAADAVAPLLEFLTSTVVAPWKPDRSVLEIAHTSAPDDFVDPDSVGSTMS